MIATKESQGAQAKTRDIRSSPALSFPGVFSEPFLRIAVMRVLMLSAKVRVNQPMLFAGN